MIPLRDGGCKKQWRHGPAAVDPGWVVQVDPVKLQLIPPGTKRLKLNYGHTGFNCCF